MSLPGNYRIGYSHDLHRLKKGRPLFLGGVLIPSPKGAVADSDGDVVLHAVAEAIFGALGKGDLGTFFPRSAVPPGMPSKIILDKALSLMKEHQYQIVNVDVTIDLERPHLKEYKAVIKDHLAQLLHTDPTCVALKATTMEGCGAIGRHKAIACSAVILLERSNYD